MLAYFLFHAPHRIGTGKTQVARIYARLLKEWGYLSKGEYVATTAKDFQSNGFVGNGEGKMSEILVAAQGCVLLIDEAYDLNPKVVDTSTSIGCSVPPHHSLFPCLKGCNRRKEGCRGNAHAENAHRFRR